MNQIPVLIFLTVILLTRMFFYYDSRDIYHENEKFETTYSFMHEPRKNAFGQYFFIDGILISMPLYPTYQYGETVKIAGTLKKITTQRGEMLTVKNPEITKTTSQNFLLGLSGFVRGRIETTVLGTLPEREAGLLLGIILGVRDKIDNDFNKVLRDVGVLHVVAASGQNVSIIASILLVSLERVVKRRYAILFTGLGILFYALLAGFDPPIVRASIMALITFGAMALGKQSKGLMALIITGWVMVLVSPRLLGDISFQLSFLSTLGIISIKPLIDVLVKVKYITILKDDISTTLSAQIATFPLIMSAFGSYSLISLPVNVLVLWTVPLIMVFGGAGALISIVSPLLAKPLILLAFPFLAFFTGITDLSSKFYYSIGVESLPQIIVIGYYVMLFAIVFKLNSMKRGKF